MFKVGKLGLDKVSGVSLMKNFTKFHLTLIFCITLPGLILESILLWCHECSFSVIYSKHYLIADFLVLRLLQLYSPLPWCLPKLRCMVCITDVSTGTGQPIINYSLHFDKFIHFCNAWCLLQKMFFFDEEWRIYISVCMRSSLEHAVMNYTRLEMWNKQTLL